MKTERDAEKMQWQAKEHQGLQEVTSSWEDLMKNSSLESFREHGHTDTLILDF